MKYLNHYAAKLAFVLFCSTPVFTAYATPIDNDWYTTSNNLDWLDVTVTRAMSYNEVIAQIGTDGTGSATFGNVNYGSGWRYATDLEFTALLADFGFVDPTPDIYGAIDIPNDGMQPIITGSNGEDISTVINMLGDTGFEHYDTGAFPGYTFLPGDGYTYGLIDGNQNNSHITRAIISDRDFKTYDGQFDPANIWDFEDYIVANHTLQGQASRQWVVGSFLVRDSVATVPEPGSLFLLALGIAGISLRQRGLAKK